MDLKNNKITVGELLKNPRSKEVLMRRFPGVINLPIVKTSGSLSLDKAVKMASAYVPRKILQETIEELKNL